MIHRHTASREYSLQPLRHITWLGYNNPYIVGTKAQVIKPTNEPINIKIIFFKRLLSNKFTSILKFGRHDNKAIDSGRNFYVFKLQDT